MRLTATPRILEFYNACHDPHSGKFCHAGVSKRYSRGILAKGTESYGYARGTCGKKAGESGLCKVHEKIYAKYEAENKRRRELTAKGINWRTGKPLK